MTTKKTTIRLLSIILPLFTIILFLPAANVLAADAEVRCGSDRCRIVGDDPLFSENKIFPGWSETKTLKVKNNLEDDMDFAFKIRRGFFFDSTPPLADVLDIKIREKGKTSNLYGPSTIKELRNKGFVRLSKVNADSEKTYEITVSLRNVGDEYQNKKLSFNIDMSFAWLPPQPENGDIDEEDIGDAVFPTVLGAQVFDGLVDFVRPLLGVTDTAFAEEKEAEDEIEEDVERIGEDDGEVLAVTEEDVCQNPWWWFLLYVLQVILLASFFVYSTKFFKFMVFLSVVVTGAVALIFWFNMCSIWFSIIAVIIGLVFTALTIYKRAFSR